MNWEETLDLLEKGELRAANKVGNDWIVNTEVKEGILASFKAGELKEFSEEHFHGFVDKHNLAPKKLKPEDGIRMVPGGTSIRRGSYVSRGVILMPPAYVNVGAYVDEGTMIDSHALVGSCAQIGKNVHLSGGVGIGGVLEPLQAAPVIIEDGAFIGSRCIVVEGVRVEKEAVLGANVVLTMSTKIIDVTGEEPKEMKGVVPSRSVVIPGSYTKSFPSGDYNVPCALIIGKRKESTDKKTSLNDALREYNVAV